MDEPVAWSYDNKFNWDSWGDGTWQISISQHQEAAYQIPIYTAPQKKEWVGLTEAERIDILDAEITTQSTEHFALAQAIEAKLKEKNT